MIDPMDADDHASPLPPEERNGLIPTYITLRSELNELEQQNNRTSEWPIAGRSATGTSF